MCGRFSRPKKIGKRSSASLFFTLQAIYCLQGQYLTGLALQPIPERPPVRRHTLTGNGGAVLDYGGARLQTAGSSGLSGKSRFPRE